MDSYSFLLPLSWYFPLSLSGLEAVAVFVGVGVDAGGVCAVDGCGGAVEYADGDSVCGVGTFGCAGELEAGIGPGELGDVSGVDGPVGAAGTGAAGAAWEASDGQRCGLGLAGIVGWMGLRVAGAGRVSAKEGLDLIRVRRSGLLGVL